MSSIERQIFNNMQKSGKMSRIVSPHRFEVPNSIYGQNDIRKMWHEPGYDTDEWPDSSHAPKIMTAGTDIVDIFYQPLFERMVTQYWDYAAAKNGYKTHEDLKKIPYCSITKLCEDAHSFPTIIFHPEKDDRKIAEQYGSDIFTPCLPEYCIKLERRHMLYVKLLEKTEHTCKVQFDDYVIQNRKTSCISRWIAEYMYDETTQSINWISEKCVTYEEFLTEFIDDMKWSKQEKKFWYDLFDIGPADSPTVVEIPLSLNPMDDILPEDAEVIKMQPIVIWNKLDAEWLIREFKRYAGEDLKVVDSGKSVWTNQKQLYIDRICDKCLTAMALVNVQFIKNNTTVITPEQTNANITVGSMIVRTPTPLRTSLSI